MTRLALSDAAFRLALEHGLEHVLVGDIAAAVEVSPRTFNNYFSSKEEAVMARAFDRVARVLEAFQRRPLTEPLWDSVTQAILAQFPGTADGDNTVRIQAVPGLDRRIGPLDPFGVGLRDENRHTAERFAPFDLDAEHVRMAGGDRRHFTDSDTVHGLVVEIPDRVHKRLPARVRTRCVC